jgi:hypothetical protein
LAFYCLRQRPSRRPGTGAAQSAQTTFEYWEQGRAKPNVQAALLIRMVAQFPDMVLRLAAI